MRSVTTILPSTTRLAPIPRPATRALATVLLAAMLVTSTDARADNAPGLEEEALAQLATEALSRGVTGPGSQESRAALIALGVAGLCLGPATGPRTRHARSTMPGVAHRLAWPMAGAALGSLVACDGPCGSRHVTAGPLIGAMAGALIAHALDTDTSRRRHDRENSHAASGVAWTPMIAIGPDGCSAGLTGRF